VDLKDKTNIHIYRYVLKSSQYSHWICE